jgi:hypothetical protein
MEAVEKWAGILGGGSLDVSPGHGVRKSADVTVDDSRVQPQQRCSFDEMVLTERAPERIDGLREHSSRRVLGAFGPQPADELLAADTDVSGRCQLREHGERATLNGRPGHWRPIAKECEPSERSKLQHRTSI